MSAYRLTGESKIEGVCEFIETLADNGAKFLVFSHHWNFKLEGVMTSSGQSSL